MRPPTPHQLRRQDKLARNTTAMVSTTMRIDIPPVAVRMPLWPLARAHPSKTCVYSPKTVARDSTARATINPRASSTRRTGTNSTAQTASNPMLKLKVSYQATFLTPKAGFGIVGNDLFCQSY